MNNTSTIALTEESFHAAFKLHYSPMCRLIFRIVRDKEVCEDLVQELFVRLWEKRETIQIQGALKSYLYRAAMNSALNHVSSKRVKTRNSLDSMVMEPSSSETPEALSNANELQESFHKALMDLPEGCREIFMLSRFEQLSYKEIAETLEISPKTVENQMGKALKVLREKLGSFISLSVLIFILLKFIKP